MTTLDARTLNRATLDRQWLLARQDRTALDAIAHLVGIQAQEPLEPYTGLWSRLAAFAPADLAGLLERKEAARALMMRRTLHLLAADDVRGLRPLHEVMLLARVRGTLGPRMPGVDLVELAAAGAALFEQEPCISGDVARALADRWPEVSVRDLADALSSGVPLVQVPPRGVWGDPAASGRARLTTYDAWWGPDPTPDAPAAVELDDVVLRYLRAYGPAASADVRAWSGLTGLPAVIARLRPQLRSYRDERGRELLDVDGLDLPDPDTPAPPRFLPAFDNAVLGYDDRSRLIDASHRGLSVLGTRFVLVDGRVAGSWTTTTDDDGAVTVKVEQLRRFSRTERDDVEAEGCALATFLGDGVAGRVETAPV
ncbi:conserved hypothetical protein [Beutenbergia cavernae DSM 12333]|uniref:Winged helix DNA-binding domain-containing protein n=1 Tax=Beutenbergia cavernae (strain ATCC BAA-8 / DSM 12333 / CCUG 43141 / JCM 11478 / NBRC 16432 / NCIMB 13614 / HKI 0122) TaxID=471853 RepID=C5C1K2_BEUC1|nr:winged helix DNA-binding domain-containing protein [Beutenbergia cavernae]ACQ81612.1 conserved hypothetical protein [Beutenbergia cavernae DSM 12333]